VEPWCDGLAGLVAAYCQRWDLGQDVATLRSSAEGVEFIYGLIARRAQDFM
jgi:hypothetical protein